MVIMGTLKHHHLETEGWLLCCVGRAQVEQRIYAATLTPTFQQLPKSLEVFGGP